PPSSPLSSIISLHDALPISRRSPCPLVGHRRVSSGPHSLAPFLCQSRLLGLSPRTAPALRPVHVRPCHSLPCRVAQSRHLRRPGDRKSTRLNSSHVAISYAV